MRIFDLPLEETQTQEFEQVIKLGALVVVPTDTVYGIGASPWSIQAVDRLLTAKGRGRDFPSPVLVADATQALELTSEVPEAATKLMNKYWPGALTIVLPAREDLALDLGVTGGTVAVRVPDQSELRRLLKRVGPLAVTSANLHGEPPALDVQQAQRYFGEKVSIYLNAGDAGESGVPSTIVKFVGAELEVLREGSISEAELRQAAR